MHALDAPCRPSSGPPGSSASQLRDAFRALSERGSGPEAEEALAEAAEVAEEVEAEVAEAAEAEVVAEAEVAAEAAVAVGRQEWCT